mgnify:CR=1 FL=1
MSKRDILQFEGCTVAWQRALAQAGVTLDDLSFVETHDCFTIAELIEYLSRRMTLLPGDVIATGTPSGVGRPRGIFLKPGDRVRISLDCVGTLENPVVQGV